MPRGSSKHGPRVDEELDQETRSLQQAAPVESHVEEFREQEGAGDDEPTPDARLVGGRATAASLSLDEAEARADLARRLSPSIFPADRDALLASAREHQAPEPLLDRLAELPAGVRFENVAAVWRALGGSAERRF